VADLGVSRQLSEKNQTMTPAVGPPYMMAPEATTNCYDERSDTVSPSRPGAAYPAPGAAAETCLH
jgi:hypothetical protein